jgi:hypothetical protein
MQEASPMHTARDERYRTKSAGRRDRARLRRLRASVLAKATASGLNAAVEDETLLAWLWELTRDESGMEIITAHEVSAFEVIEELISSIGADFSEEIQTLHDIIIVGILRWQDRGMRTPAQWSPMLRRTFLEVWLGERLQPEA